MNIAWKEFEINSAISNPSYNNDVYIDFVKLIHHLTTDNTVAITPAKWQAKSGESNEDFRQNIVPYMEKIVYYPDCGDIFKIGEVGGITYFSLTKEKYEKCSIVNKCKTNKHINNATAYRSIDNRLSCYCDSIIEKIEQLHESKLKLDTINDYNYMITTPPAIGGTKGEESFLFGSSGMCQCLKIGKIYNRAEANEMSSCYGILCSSNSIAELQFKKSYMYTKFVRFLVLIGIHTQSTLKAETWRFVPVLLSLITYSQMQSYMKNII